jgi:hypothetical protein
MLQQTREIRSEIVKYIANSGVSFPRWHIGIASDPHTRLFIDKNIDKDSYWIYKDAGSQELARDAAKFLIDTYSFISDAGNSDGTSHYVYAYADTQKNNG